MSYILTTGGDVELTDVDRTRVYDRIEILDAGVVVCINTKQYQKDCYPLRRVESIHTHTSEEENAEWWPTNDHTPDTTESPTWRTRLLERFMDRLYD